MTIEQAVCSQVDIKASLALALKELLPDLARQLADGAAELASRRTPDATPVDANDLRASFVANVSRCRGHNVLSKEFAMAVIQLFDICSDRWSRNRQPASQVCREDLLELTTRVAKHSLFAECRRQCGGTSNTLNDFTTIVHATLVLMKAAVQNPTLLEL